MTRNQFFVLLASVAVVISIAVAQTSANDSIARRASGDGYPIFKTRSAVSGWSRHISNK